MADQDDEKASTTAPDGDAKEELLEAVEHFKKAANLLFDRASKDPTVKQATQEAERVIKKLGDSAEPLARQVTSELAKLTKRISEATAGKKKSEPPPDDPAT